MEKEKLSTQELVERYKDEVEYFSRYIPWFEKKTADMVARMYRGEGTNDTFAFPVYDATLLSFINEAGTASFINPNYRYIYSRYDIHNYKDEWRAIEETTIMNMEVIGGILSKYILGGVTKAALWKEAVQYEIFLRCLKKMKEIVEFWDKPLEENFDLLHPGQQ
ncbi:MAG: hypothetical protein IJ711_10185 [Lachnospiraceae bacterium]|nr:hypothetical protein [Lachnospiraceae bacterium]